MRKLNLGHKTEIFGPPEKEDFLKNPVLKSAHQYSRACHCVNFDLKLHCALSLDHFHDSSCPDFRAVKKNQLMAVHLIMMIIFSVKQGWETHGGHSGCIVPYTYRWLPNLGWKGILNSGNKLYNTKTFLTFYFSFLFQDYESHIRSLLPDNNFSIMVSVLKKFFNFMNLTASVSFY